MFLSLWMKACPGDAARIRFLLLLRRKSGNCNDPMQWHRFDNISNVFKCKNQIPSFLRLLNVFEPKKGARHRLKNIGHSEHCWTYLPLENIRNILKPLLLFWIIAIPEASKTINRNLMQHPPVIPPSAQKH